MKKTGEYENEILRILDRLPKYIETCDECYHLAIIKNDWDGYANINSIYSWMVMYAKRNTKSISLVKYQIRVVGATFLEALQNMEVAYDRFKIENRENPNIARM
jgi:hypothetical protein